MWKMIWYLWHSKSLDGRPFYTLLRGKLRFLRFARVLLRILVICVISLRECLPPWINLKALLHHLDVHLEWCKGSMELLDSRAKRVNKTEDFHSLHDSYLTSLKPYPKRVLGSRAALAPLNSAYDVFWQLSKNEGCIYNGGGGVVTQNSGCL